MTKLSNGAWESAGRAWLAVLRDRHPNVVWALLPRGEKLSGMTWKEKESLDKGQDGVYLGG